MGQQITLLALKKSSWTLHAQVFEELVASEGKVLMKFGKTLVSNCEGAKSPVFSGNPYCVCDQLV